MQLMITVVIWMLSGAYRWKIGVDRGGKSVTLKVANPSTMTAEYVSRGYVKRDKDSGNAVCASLPLLKPLPPCRQMRGASSGRR